MPSVELSIILPAYNEASVIYTNILIIQKKLDDQGIDYEIIVVNDGSTDNTLEQATLAQDSKVRVISYDVNRGKGYAIKYGMQHAQGKYRMFMDVDLSTSLDEVEKFLTVIHQGQCELVIGYRNMRQNQPWYREFLGKGFTILANLLIFCDCQDFTCGFKMFTAKACDQIFPRQRIFDWAFDAELLYLAKKSHLKVCQLPVQWQHQGDSKVRLARDVFNSLMSLLKIRWNAIKGRYRL